MSQENSPNIIRKIGPKQVMEGKIKDIEMAEGGETTLYTLIGRADRVKTGESTFGPWSSLMGNFEACRLHDGKTFIAPACFLPEPLHSAIVDKVRSLTNEGEFVEFAVYIGIKESDTSTTGYEYVTTPIVTPEFKSGLDHLRAALEALPPPTAVTTETTTTETVTDKKPSKKK